MSSRLAEHAVRRFAAHETFAPRFGWLRKAHVAVSVSDESLDTPGSSAFLDPDAPIELGVGKNMVASIRYWAQAFGITVESPASHGSRALHAHPTAEGKWLLADDGVDPWLERSASLWLLHWWLLRSKCMAPTWWVAFNSLSSLRFSEDELLNLVETQVSLADWPSVMASSIEKDIDCLTKMYAPRRNVVSSRGGIEDLLDCPFRELGLIEAVPEAPKTWRFTDNPRLAVPAAVVAYAALDYMARNDLSGQVTTARLAHEPGGVGKALRLTEPGLSAALAEVAATHRDLQLVESVGQRTLQVTGDPGALAQQVISAYYAPISRPRTKRTGEKSETEPKPPRRSRTVPA